MNDAPTHRPIEEPAAAAPAIAAGAPQHSSIRIGTAGWSIPRISAVAFPGSGSHLHRYARMRRDHATFYRAPRSSTLARWAASVPTHFRFSVKAPKTITDEAALACTPLQLRSFFDEAAQQLGTALGPILFQLPPKLASTASAWPPSSGSLRQGAALQKLHGACGADARPCEGARPGGSCRQTYQQLLRTGPTFRRLGRDARRAGPGVRHRGLNAGNARLRRRAAWLLPRWQSLQFCASVRNGFVPASRRSLFSKLKPLETDICPFANFPETGPGRWGRT